MENIIHSWSGGKDSSLALYELMKTKDFNPICLLTTMTRDFGRVTMHGVRKELMIKQAEMIGLPLDIAYISKNSTNDEYDKVMKRKLTRYISKGITKVSFGDIFLVDIREYRESRLKQIGMKGIFPLWGMNTRELSKKILSLGFKAIICTIDPKKLSKEFAGKEYDEKFLQSLPDGVDPCGEYGEFHTFVYDGPIFTRPLKIQVKETVLRDSFYFTDIALA